MHDILIGGLIAIIVMAQILVAITTSKKIALFKTIVPEANSFETVKVFIPEDQIKTVTVEHILNNLDSFSNPTLVTEQIKKKTKKKIKISEAIAEEYNTDTFTIANEVNDLNLFDINHNDEVMVWITKGNLDKKIPKKDLSNYKSIGWASLSDDNINSQN
ncbi:hypothetical protein RCH18_001982 [Flavobacterium sp. PL11]|jgi:hypothetical protein|uniref:hypothetical protein n=1 Tax=Flavobacterium sp. PL11 TaxID=3071717 RepID=UPI002E079198|nr:hypothetical protein [Flavobacterium sp. PL11]